jgi:hypothetical protein
MSLTNTSTPEQVASDDGMPESAGQETTAQRLVRELREANVESSRIALQFSQGVINPMELAKFLGIRPQQVYQAIRDGKLSAVKQNNTQKLVIENSEAIRYAATYLDRKAQRLLQQAQELAAAS